MQAEEASGCEQQALGDSGETKPLLYPFQEADGQCDEVPGIVLKMVH